MVSKIADALEVVEFLVDKTKMKLDEKILECTQDIETLNKESKDFVLRVLDMTLRDIKTQKAYA